MQVPSGQSLASRPAASLARALGRPRPRSVGSEQLGRAIEPRNRYGCGCRRSWNAGRQYQKPRKGKRWLVHRGRRTRHGCNGAPQEPEKVLSSPLKAGGSGAQGTTEACRDGRQEVGAARGTDEAGEPTRGTLRREGAAEKHGTAGGKDGRDTRLGDHLHETRADSDTGERGAETGLHLPVASHRHRMAPGGLPADPEGWSTRSRRPDAAKRLATPSPPRSTTSRSSGSRQWARQASRRPCAGQPSATSRG